LTIGEAFPESSQIMGAVISIRNKNGHKISVWTKNAADRAVCMTIGLAQTYTSSS
jgi:hypothetical protein